MKDINEVRSTWNRRIKKRCAELSWTQQDLADEINANFPNGRHVTQSMISHWTRIGKGRSTFPPYERMRQIASVLGVDIAYLTGDINEDTHEEQTAMRYLKLGASGIKGLRHAIEAKDASSEKRRRLMFNTLFATNNFSSDFATHLESYSHAIRTIKYYTCKSPIAAKALILSMQLPFEMYKFNTTREFEKCLSEMQSKLTATPDSLLDKDGKQLLEMQETEKRETPKLKKLEREYLQYDIKNSGIGEWIQTYMNRALQELAEEEDWAQGPETPWDQLVKSCGSEEGALDFVIDFLKEAFNDNQSPINRKDN